MTSSLAELDQVGSAVARKERGCMMRLVMSRWFFLVGGKVNSPFATACVKNIMRIDHSGSFQSSRSARAFGLREPVKRGEFFPSILAAYER